MFPVDESITSVESTATASSINAGEQEASKPLDKLKACCIATINVHARFNPMMVCADCKHIIKCFKDVGAYDKYLIFCNSRKRHVAVGRVNEYHTIVFKSYDTFR